MCVSGAWFAQPPSFKITKMNRYNLIHAVVDITGSPSDEPLTIEEVKHYLRLEGFISDEDSPSTDFTDDDTLIADLIASARERLEAWTGVSFIPKVYQAELTNLAGNIRLPYGPVRSITSVEDENGTGYPYTLTIDLNRLKTPLMENLIVTYESGYVTLPHGLKEAMLKEIAYRYEHRGDEYEDTGVCKAAQQLASYWKEVDTWLA